MEGEPRKIINPELQDSINENLENLNELEELLKESIDLYKEGLEILQDDLDYLEHMGNSNEMADFLNDMAEELGKEPTSKKYSNEEINKVKADIEKMQKDTDAINKEIAQLILNKVEITHYVDRFRLLEEKFRATLLKLKPESLN